MRSSIRAKLIAIILFVNMGVVDKKVLSYVNNNKKNAVITLKEWNKIYINLGPNITDVREANYFKVYISGTIDKGSEAEYYFDNIKVIYRE